MLLFTLALTHAEPFVPWYTILACSCSLLRSRMQSLLYPGTKGPRTHYCSYPLGDNSNFLGDDSNCLGDNSKCLGNDSNW